MLETLKNYIDAIRNHREQFGEEHPLHDLFFTQIDIYYDTLTEKEQEEFNNYCK